MMHAEQDGFIAEFFVESLNSPPIPLRTYVQHDVLNKRDVILIEQDDGTGGTDRVLLDRADFERLANMMKGH